MSEESMGSAPKSAPVENTEAVENTEQNQETQQESSNESVDKSNKIDKDTAPEEIAPENGKRMFKVKVNGKEQEVTEEELKQGYQTRKASDEKFREAAMKQKQAEEFINLLRTNPKKVLSDPNLGIDLRKFAEDYLVEQMEEEMMDPKEKELREAKRKLEEIEEEKKRQAREREEAEAAELKERFSSQYQTGIIEALQTSGLPKTEHTVKRMAYYMYQGLKRNYNLAPKDVVSMVKQDYINEQKSLYGQLDGDMLIELLGPEVAQKIRKHDVAKHKKSGKAPQQPEKQPTGGKIRKKKSKKIDKDTWKAKLDKIKRGEE